MSDLISREAVLELFATHDGNYLYEAIRDMPAVEPERKLGRWIPQDRNKVNGMASTAVYYYPKCSVCGHCANYTNFCSACGADMRGEQDE